jgi:hypothetical protein
VLRSELWVASPEHARAAALIAEAQSEAEAAADRETAALAAERERAAAEEARVAATAALVNAESARRAARKAARLAQKAAAHRLRQERKALHPAAKPHKPSASIRGVRIAGGVLAAFIFVLLLIGMVGEHYGTHKPMPGHDGQTVVCHGRYQVVCF